MTIQSRRELNRAKARKAAAIVKAARVEIAAWLQANGALNWLWPGPTNAQPDLHVNCWPDSTDPAKRRKPRGVRQAYSGSSDRVVSRRCARKGTKGLGHRYTHAGTWN